MADRVWTPAQESAINTRDKTLLVSAAAGSGKTATLTERIIRSLTDTVRPERITSLLVVTFTNAAATELRAKIATALSEAVAKNPGDKELERQLMLLPTATIGTIHSFCNDVVRANADKVGLPPNYRVADTAELELIERSVIDGLVTAIYRGEIDGITPDALEELSDTLTNSRRTEDLGEILRYVYDKCCGSPDGVESLVRVIDAYNPESFVSVEKTQHGSYLMSVFGEIIDSAEQTLKECLKNLSPTDKVDAKYSAVIADDLAQIDRLRAASEGYNSVRDAIPATFKSNPPRGKEPSCATLAAIEARSIMRDDLDGVYGYFLYTEEQWRALYTGLNRLFGTLYRLLSLFDRVYSEEKRRRGIISYGDMERYAYKILWSDGPTDTAKNLAARYTSVYIDEYQDVNSLQNRIFEAISKPDNRFMVGDIKQSIYGFRRACPDIFAAMKAAFPPLKDATGDSATIFMSNNFRCNRSVVDFVNGVFDRIFSLVGDSIGYEDGDKLCYSKLQKGGEPIYRKPELCLVPKGGVPDENGEPMMAPEVVARRIRALIDHDTLDNGNPVEPRDVAILLRTKGSDALYAGALAREGIASVLNAEEKLFFHTPEVLLTLCLLNAIDNPRRDVYLAGLLCSPLYGFDADDLYKIQHGGGGKCLYDALRAYTADHPDYEKGVEFLSALAHYRAIAEGMAVDKLIYKLYYETGLLSLAAANGGRDNLMLLYDYARGFAAGSFKGLYSFISFVNNLTDRKSSFDEGREGEAENAVTIVTCHHSKGLEYPIVFLADAADRLGKTESSRIVYSEDMGAAMKLRTPSGLGIVENPARDLIIKYEKSREYDEELRVLYVALTRARERLYIVGDAPTVKYDDYLARLAAKREIMNAHVVRGLSSYFEMIYTCGEGVADVSPDAFLAECKRSKIEKTHESGDFDTDISENSDESGKAYTISFQNRDESGNGDTAENEGNSGCGESRELYELLCERFAYRYPRSALTELPEKMSVSRMTPTVLDESEEIFDLATDDDRPVVPKFIDGTASDESAKRGIATHYFMQFCDLEAFERNGTAAELARLVSGGYLSTEDGERVRKEEIEAFRRSSLFSDMRKARRIWRELRFNTRLPATEFTADDGRRAALADSDILVQGVIDCVIEDADGNLRIIDYKTDRLSREERADAGLAELTMRQKHGNQLYYYSLAVERIFGKAPTRVEVYSLHLGDTLSVKRD